MARQGGSGRDEEPVVRQPDTGGEQHGADDRPAPGNAGRIQPYEEAQTLAAAVGPTEDEPEPDDR